MDPSILKEQIKNISIWKRGDERAPHKPLLILLALSKLKNENKRLLAYEEIKEPLKDLLIEFGPYRQSYHPEQPFARLINDGIWQLNTSVERKQISNRFLLEHEVAGGFNEEIYSLLTNNKSLINEVANLILENHFPESIHEDILNSIGLYYEKGIKRRRDPKFRDKILKAYEYKCAVCGFNIRIRNKLVAVEAAHIKWHQAGGPDSEDNGIALCSMHHKLFDRGVFTISKSKKLMIAEMANGTNGLEEWLLRYHGKQIHSPIRPTYNPHKKFIDWHSSEVFKGPARYSSGL